MNDDMDKVRDAARLLGKRGGTATLNKYGPEQLREWGKLGARFGKLGGWPKGRPRKPKSAKSERAR